MPNNDLKKKLDAAQKLRVATLKSKVTEGRSKAANTIADSKENAYLNTKSKYEKNLATSVAGYIKDVPIPVQSALNAKTNVSKNMMYATNKGKVDANTVKNDANKAKVEANKSKVESNKAKVEANKAYVTKYK